MGRLLADLCMPSIPGTAMPWQHEAMLAAVLSAGEVLQQVCMAGRSCSMRHLARVQQGGSDGMGIQEAEYESSEEDVPE